MENVKQAVRLGKATVPLLEMLEEATSKVQRLRRRLTPAYHLLDPLLPREGKFLARWRLRLNVPPEELQAVVRT